MIRPCERSVRCFPCADDNPFANLSAEDPDLNVYLSVVFVPGTNPPHNNWNAWYCTGFCESAISQEDADDCARRKALECYVNTQPPPKPDNRSWPDPVCNQSRTCRTDGQCYTMPAGTVCAFSVLEANALAESLCNHRVHDSTLTSPCPAVQSPPLAPTEEVPCPAEAGSPTPASLEISSEQLWETHSLTHDVITDFNLVGVCQDTGLGRYTPTNPIDHPPGYYGFRYLDGFVHKNNPAYCSDPPYDAAATAYSLQNELHNYDTGETCASPQYLANKLMPGGSSGVQGCFADEAAAVSSIYAGWLAKTFKADPYPPNGTDGFGHTNDGGDFSIMQFGFGPEGDPDVSYPVGPIRFQIVELEGLIPQPRKVAISNYAAVKSQFADQPAANAWDGKFPERTVYNSMTVQWAVTAADAFGGAVLKWTDAHPTSANGKGWQMDIFSSGAILLWRGFKGLGSTPVGRFHKDSTSTPIGPSCVECADDSDTQWFP